MNIFYEIEGEVITLDLQGETIKGGDEVLLNKDINLLQNTNWNEEGYTIVPFVSDAEFATIKKGITQKIAKIIEDCGGKIDENFSLDKYHLYVDDEIHLKLAKTIKDGWLVSEFPIDFQIINDRMSEILGVKVATELKGSQFDSFFLRIIRPKEFRDNNPPHRDVWIDRLRHAVNIYAPLSASNMKSSLPIMPGSHLFKESEIVRTADGAFLNGTKYTVPCVISVKDEMPKLIRLDPKENEMMIFSPYMVHGGGYNLNEDTTRTSLEVRFWKVDSEASVSQGDSGSLMM
jgi:hypothetical protein